MNFRAGDTIRYKQSFINSLVNNENDDIDDWASEFVQHITDIHNGKIENKFVIESYSTYAEHEKFKVFDVRWNHDDAIGIRIERYLFDFFQEDFLL